MFSVFFEDLQKGLFFGISRHLCDLAHGKGGAAIRRKAKAVVLR